MSVLELLLVLALLVLGYIYVGYPALLFVLARGRPDPHLTADITPTVTLLVPVHNEVGVIAEKIANFRALDYPRDRLSGVVISDGSDDGTEAVVAALAGQDLELLALPRCGKVRALNAGAAAAQGEILVFTDANSMMAQESLRALVRSFADPRVGGVCGNQRYRDRGGDSTGAGEGLYWRFDKWQKGLESRIGSIFAADGSLYAIRRELFAPVLEPAQADDIAISARVVLQGYRLVIEPLAVTVEDAPEDGAAEFARKVRVTNHSVRALLGLGRGLWTSGFYSLELISHKLLRHLAPVFLVVALVTNLAVAGGEPVFALTLALQLLCYGLAGFGFALRRRRSGRSRWLTVPYFFCLANAAAAVGLLSLLRGARLVTWTPRGADDKG